MLVLISSAAVFWGKTETLKQQINNVLSQTDSQQLTPTLETSGTPPMSGNDVLSEVNFYRNENNISELNHDDEACNIAERILDSQFWRTDYDVNKYKDLCPRCFSLSIAQARDIHDTAYLLSMWKSDNTSLKTLKNAGKNACAVVNRGNIVLVVTKKSAAATATKTTTNTDSVVDCDFVHLPDQQMSKAQCSASFECQIGEQWYIYSSRDKCTQDQKNSLSSNTGGTYSPPMYQSCTIYYPGLGYSQTYTYLSTADCDYWRNQANSGSTDISNTAPVPTADLEAEDEYNKLLQEHRDACNAAAAEWIYMREEFMSGEANNYSSSFDAFLELERRRQTYQQELYDLEYSNTI